MNKEVLPANFESVVQNVINMVARHNTFGSYTREDIAQEIWVLSLEAMPGWDGKRSLYNFLLTNAKNRLKNLKRDNYFRYECPCKLCSFKEAGQTGHPGGAYCQRYLKWYGANLFKSSLASSMGHDFNGDAYVDWGDSHEDKVADADIFEVIDQNIPAALRKSYLKMKGGTSVSNVERAAVLEFLQGLFQE